MNKEPYQKFKEWFDKESALTKVRIKTACCLSTIGIDGYPNARFVSLKDITKEGFIVTGTTSSKKGIEIETNSKVALTFWWTETEKQIRIQGDAQRISDKQADRYFKARNKESQIVSVIFRQGEEADNYASLKEDFELSKSALNNKTITRPKNWHGYIIKPKRIEFFEFMPDRFSKRLLYELKEGGWSEKIIIP